jgi:hypothetical protein
MSTTLTRLELVKGERAWRAADRAAGVQQVESFAETERNGYWAGVANAPEHTWAEIDSDAYWEALEVLPPIYFPGGFAVSEAMTANAKGEEVYLCVVTIGKSSTTRHFAGYRTLAQMRKEWSVLP